jgi:isochorismate synthase
VSNTIIDTISISTAIATCVDKNLVFAAYRLPNNKYSELVVQTSNTVKTISDSDSHFNLKGFLVAPFSESTHHSSFLISADIYASGDLSTVDYNKIKKLETQPIQSDSSHIPEEISHDQYIEQLNSIIKKIQQGTFEKVVPSRVKIVKGNYTSQLSELYSRLVDAYPNAFVYIFNAGPHLWIGATPEPLLKTTNGTMNTVSLAGTRAYSNENLNIGAWNSKERLEQEYVTRYISKVLSKFNLLDVVLTGPYTKRAGNLVHLRTDFTFRAEELKYCLGEFLKNLHPTPAVCGMPRKESLELILGLERHQREYYAGFLGPVGLNNRLSLFVNLRCMKVLETNLALFIGGGITADSVAEEEWVETDIKAETLLSVIRSI